MSLICFHLLSDAKPTGAAQVTGSTPQPGYNPDSVGVSSDSPDHRQIKHGLKNVVPKLLLIPRIIMFMPLEKILDPILWRFTEQDNNVAVDKMHNEPSLKLLFDEDYMDWIMSMIFYCEYADAKLLLFFSALTGAAFGSIHCAAWNFEFPSHAEKIMWRTASLALVGVCLSIFLGKPARYLWRKVKYGSLSRYLADALSEYEGIKAIAFIPTIIYPVARFTLLILAVLSLRHLPDSALQTVTWTEFIPHI